MVKYCENRMGKFGLECSGGERRRAKQWLAASLQTDLESDLDL